MKREHSFASSLVHPESSEMHILGAASGENMPRDSPVVDTGPGTVTPPVPAAPAAAGLDSAPHPPAPGSAPARRHLPCTSGRGPPRTAGGRWPGFSSRRTNSCLCDRESSTHPGVGNPTRKRKPHTSTPRRAVDAGDSRLSPCRSRRSCSSQQSAITALSPFLHGAVKKGPTIFA